MDSNQIPTDKNKIISKFVLPMNKNEPKVNLEPFNIAPLGMIPEGGFEVIPFSEKALAFLRKKQGMLSEKRKEIPIPTWLRSRHDYVPGDWVAFCDTRSDGHKTDLKYIHRDGTRELRSRNEVEAFMNRAMKSPKPIFQGSKLPTQETAGGPKASQKQHDAAKITSQKYIATMEVNKQPMIAAATDWNQPNPNFRYGEPMLTAAELATVGLSTAALHSYYMKGCVEKQNGILVAFKSSHFWRSFDSEYFPMGFHDLYDLFNFHALDVSILRCYTLSMHVEVRAKGLSVGFLDPEVMSGPMMRANQSYVVEYVIRAFHHYSKNEIIMFAHNPGGHWVSVVDLQRWGKVFYFDSIMSTQRDLTMVREVLDEAFLAFCSSRKMSTNNLVHVTNFPCHQQKPEGNECGFYTAHHMVLALDLANLNELEQFEVPTSPLGEYELSNIQEGIASFLMNQVINPKGEFHCLDHGIY